ncbi:xanthine dehydrogenase accessory factor [Mesorhizobium albiziae]|uniref:Xanthine dehydrogenase accessory factor n=1 Tax=Neomesorhizobium albiziae TaxID=335020 RepID=A0A1I4A0A7_9HYPH|nr:xanthine dehydrogenase accessory protein XdhC [Mesorhizobium albiziae]GLS33975.1 xanthine dehydrogenase accessory protein XdhC [Mesorhizobium albiziae]SFK49768.1 xanthine dehydrogenase accessory factor [Mesorhizobium albiziae]
MTSKLQNLRTFLAAHGPVALVEVAGTKGSTPREKGAWMLVSPSAIHGTIGGGQLEYMAIDKARQMLGTSPRSSGKGARATIDVHEVCATLDVPLGPEIGQCCGGRVEVLIQLADEKILAKLVAVAESEEGKSPHIYIFGGGHVGKALAEALSLLPVRAVVIETREDELEGIAEAVETRLTPLPEEVVREAPAGSAFAVLTHDHALDFLIVAEALKRGDTAYVGMIGSQTKKATFKSWFLKTAGGTEQEFSRLVSPIGGDAVKDKRPQVIAALAAAEMMTALVLHAAAKPAARSHREESRAAN